MRSTTPTKQTDIKFVSVIAVICPQHGELGTSRTRTEALAMRRRHWLLAHPNGSTSA